MPLVTSFTKNDFDINAQVVITLPAEALLTHKILTVQATYTTGGVGDVYVTINAIEVYRSNVAEFVTTNWTTFDGLFGNPNEEVVITLDAGGPAITGTLDVSGRTE